MFKWLWPGGSRRKRASAPPAAPGQMGDTLQKCWDRINQMAGSPPQPELPAEFYRPLDLNALNGRVGIGREADGDTWKSVLVVEICGTIQAPAEGCDADLHVVLADVTDDANQPMPVLNRPKQGPLNGSSYFAHQADMGKLCNQTTILEDWTTVAKIAPEWFVVPRRGQRKLAYNIAIVARATHDRLASTTYVGTYENIESGYLDIEEDIQRTKTLAVGLAFSVGAANGQLMDPEVSVINAWVRTNFGSDDASDDARQELHRALQKTAAFFRRGGSLNIKEICQEVVEIAPLVGRLEILDLCLRVAAAKGKVSTAELTLLKDISSRLEIDRARLRVMVEKILPLEMHQTQDTEMILGVTSEMDKNTARHQLNREYAKWSSRVISSDPSIRRQADQMLKLIADTRTQYVGVQHSE